MCEIEAKEYLMEIADEYNIPENERLETIIWLEKYKQVKREMKRAGEWDE